MKSALLAIVGLPIALPILVYFGFCGLMSRLTGEGAKRYQLPPLPAR
jgi:hypothetical protein